MGKFPITDWNYFEAWKKRLAGNPLINGQLSLIGTTTRGDLKPFYDEKKLRQQCSAITTALSLFESDKLSSDVSDARDHLICALALLEDSVRPFTPSTDDSANARGRRSYPLLLSKEIVDVIEAAKGDSEKFHLLWEYFNPKGEFSKWIDEKSKGALSGPSCKDEFTDKVKWVKELKRTHSTSIANRSI